MWSRVSCMVLCLMCPSALAYAQVNTERFHLGKEQQEGWQTEVAGRLALSRGNVNVTDLSGSVSVRHQTLWAKSSEGDGPRALKERWSFIGNVRRARVGERIFSNLAFSHVRWTRMWRPRLGTEVFAQLQFDEFLALRLRALTGAYVRWVPIMVKGFTLALGTGYMPEYEIFDAQAVGPTYRSPRLNHRWTSYVMLTGTPNENVQVQFTSYIQPRLDRFQDLHMLQSLSASAKLVDHLSLTLNVEVQTDLEPPPTIEPVDVRVIPGFALQW